MVEPTEQEVEHLANLIGDDTKARFLLESHGPQAMADRRAAEVLEEYVYRTGIDRVLFMEMRKRAAELRGEQS